MTGPCKTGRRRTKARMTKCVACGESSLTFLGHPFYCERDRPAPRVFTGPILGEERRLIRGAAHRAVAVAIRDGVLPHPSASACAGCNKPATEYDHRDYTKPLQVDPVCRLCNARRGAADRWTEDGRLPINGRVARFLPPAVLAEVIARMSGQAMAGAQMTGAATATAKVPA